MEIYLDLKKKELDEKYFINIFEEYYKDYGIEGIIKLEYFIRLFISKKSEGE